MPMSFRLAWHERRVGPNQTPRRFLDFVVDGQSLYERHRQDFIGCLGWLSANADRDAADRLLGKAPPDIEDRVAIYLCPEDADLLCGAVTARVERDGDDIVWRDTSMSGFNWSADRWEHDPFTGWPELRFDRVEYIEAIRGRPHPLSP